MVGRKLPRHDIEQTLLDMRESREKAGLRQEDIARLLNVNRSMVSKWENGKAYPEVPTLIRLYRILHGIAVGG